MSTSVPTTGVSAAQNVVDELLSFVERTRGISQAQRRRVLDQAAIALYNTTQETPRSRIGTLRTLMTPGNSCTRYSPLQAVTQLGGTSSFASLRCAASSASDGARSTNQQVNNTDECSWLGRGGIVMHWSVNVQPRLTLVAWEVALLISVDSSRERRLYLHRAEVSCSTATTICLTDFAASNQESHCPLQLLNHSSCLEMTQFIRPLGCSEPQEG
ncbi:hypothetical protein IWX92DRAFT_386921 [Phyllosticta citricarpa]